MCVHAVIFRADGGSERAANQPELARLLRLKSLPSLDGGRAKTMRRVCLCPIDVRAAAREAGMAAEDPTWDLASDHRDAWALREAVPGAAARR